MSKDTGGPAFPIQHGVRPEWDKYSGMTLRDYFAAQAMVGLIQRLDTSREVAKGAYAIADNMLEARGK